MGAEGGFSNEKAAVLNILYLFFFLSLRKRDRGGCSFNVRDSIHPLVGENGLRGTATTILSWCCQTPFCGRMQVAKESEKEIDDSREPETAREHRWLVCVYTHTYLRHERTTTSFPLLHAQQDPLRRWRKGQMPLTSSFESNSKKRNIIEEKSVRTTLCPTRLQIARFPFRLISVEIKLKCLGSNSPH